MKLKYKLKEQSPTFQKINRIFEFMEKEGISFSVEEEKIGLSDSEDPNHHVYLLEDIEDDYSSVSDLPPIFEFKIIYYK